MFAEPDAAPDVSRAWGWLGFGVFIVFLVVGLVLRLPDAPSIAIPGALVAVIAGVPLFLARPSILMLLYAAVATSGVVLVVNVASGTSNVGWFALCVVTVWCALAGGVWTGLIYWLGCLLLFAVSWLVVVRDPGWGSWSAGVTFALFAAMLVRHQLVLVERLREAQAGLAERSRAEERNRIARELHDVIAHSLTVSLLHVSSARLAVEHDPADAARALAEAERLGRQSLADVRAVMGMARAATDDGIAAPVPGIEDLGRLVDRVRSAGVEVRLAIDGSRDLPATTGSTVYRIVQEALTNAARHAAGAVVVTVSTGVDRVDISVDSAGSPGNGSGMGVANMRERARAVGGACTAGPGGSGWLVQAWLPVDAPSGAGAP